MVEGQAGGEGHQRGRQAAKNFGLLGGEGHGRQDDWVEKATWSGLIVCSSVFGGEVPFRRVPYPPSFFA